MAPLQQGTSWLSTVLAVLLVLMMVACATGAQQFDFEEQRDLWEANPRWEERCCDHDDEDDDEGPPVEILEALESECDDFIYEEEDDCEPDWEDEEPGCGNHDDDDCPEYDDEEPDCCDDGDEGECDEDPCQEETTTQPPCTGGTTTKSPPGGGSGTTTCPPNGHTTTKPHNGGGGDGPDLGAIIGGTVGGAVGLAGMGAAAAGAGAALWKFFQRRTVPTEAATAFEGTEMSSMNENALFHSGADVHSNELFQSAAVAPADAV